MLSGLLLEAGKTLVALLRSVAEPLTALLAFAALAAALLRPLPRIRRLALNAALRRPLRASRAWKVDDDDDPRAAAMLDPDLPDQRASRGLDRIRPMEIKRRHRVLHLLSGPVRKAADGDAVLPADLVSSMLAAAPGAQLRPWPYVARRLSRLFRVASSNRATSLLAHLLYSDDARALASYFGDVSRHLLRFGDAEPVDTLRLALHRPRGSAQAADAEVPFAVFASALSGAAVLVDSVSTRSRFVDNVLVWHSRRYRRSLGAESPAVSYDALHPGSSACGLWEPQTRPAGDFDMRLLDLQAVGIAESATRGVLSFVLETSETCYAATEAGEHYPDRTRPAPGSKHIVPAPGRGDNDPRFTLASWEGGGGYRLVKDAGDRSRLTPVTAYVSMITTDDHLVLVRRSRRVRHGQGVISAAAGGLIEPEGDGSMGDVDDLGMPDPLVGVLRETREELGLDITPAAVHPVCVFLANIRNSGLPPEGGRGQLVAAVLYLCHVPYDVDGVRTRMAEADPSLGGFEVDDLVTVPLKPAADPGALTEMSQVTTAQALARFSFGHATEIDQHGLLSCLYTAAVIDGPRATIDAFTEMFRDAPWWDLSSVGEHPRVVRDPRVLFSDDIGPIDEAVASWSKSWKRLPDALARANREFDSVRSDAVALARIVHGS